MSGIQIKSRKITLDITNEDNKVIGQVAFDPKDIKVYNAFAKIYDCATKLFDKQKEIGDIKEIPEGKLNSPEDYKEAGVELAKIADFTDTAVEQFEKIYEQIDSVFGEGSCQIMFAGTYNAEALFEFLDGITPYFKSAQKERVNKYLDDKNSEDKSESDVM